MQLATEDCYAYDNVTIYIHKLHYIVTHATKSNFTAIVHVQQFEDNNIYSLHQIGVALLRVSHSMLSRSRRATLNKWMFM